jgi:hypothetical protein
MFNPSTPAFDTENTKKVRMLPATTPTYFVQSPVPHTTIHSANLRDEGKRKESKKDKKTASKDWK